MHTCKALMVAAVFGVLLTLLDTGAAFRIPMVMKKLFSSATGRFVVMTGSGEIHADGSINEATIFYVHFVSFENALVRMSSSQHPNLFMTINSETGQLQASEITNGVSTFERIYIDGQETFLVASVPLPCSGDSGNSTVPAESCNLECAIAFNSQTKRPIGCMEQSGLDGDDISKCLHFIRS